MFKAVFAILYLAWFTQALQNYSFNLSIDQEFKSSLRHFVKPDT